ncbi:unnamed protein product [Rotaria sordida]|uniref:Uncharacterized protein n=1 Tax=Rotaria sordida TaxID=392033 RepID=A0A820AWQ0_9BILA|nr:unnamed protein product [Rotaria sordida]
MIYGAHFRGGIISWRPLNNVPSGSYAQILIHQRYFWNRRWSSFSTPYCDESDVAAQTSIPVNSLMTCLQNCSSSNYASLSTVMTSTDCDSNSIIESWAGERYDNVSLRLTTSITIGFVSSAWFSSLYIGGNGSWSIVNRLNLAVRPDGYINTSPVTNTLPVVFVPVNTQTVHVVQMADTDATDILACRWSNSLTSTNYNPCIGVPYDVQLTETVIVQTYCTGQTIVDFVTSSPIGMTHSAITNPSSGLWHMTLTWTPNITQSGPEGFCAGAIDNHNLQSDPWCITYLVDYTSPNIIRPTVVQGSASPVGTVFANQSIFSITGMYFVKT